MRVSEVLAGGRDRAPSLGRERGRPLMCKSAAHDRRSCGFCLSSEQRGPVTDSWRGAPSHPTLGALLGRLCLKKKKNECFLISYQ